MCQNEIHTSNFSRRGVLGMLGVSLGALALGVEVIDPTPAQAATGGRAYSGRVLSMDSRVNLRSGPGVNYRAVGSATPNQLLRGTVHGSWLQTSAGWINIDLLTASSTATGVNGRLSTNRSTGWLRPIDHSLNSSWHGAPGYSPNTTRFLRPRALGYLMQLDTAFKSKFGHHLQIDLAYRPMSEQRYWFNKLGYPAAARPGHSNHGLGLAVDLWENSASPYRFGQPAYNWLMTNAPRYGWYQPTWLRQHGVNPEYWHFQFVG